MGAAGSSTACDCSRQRAEREQSVVPNSLGTHLTRVAAQVKQYHCCWNSSHYRPDCGQDESLLTTKANQLTTR